MVLGRGRLNFHMMRAMQRRPRMIPHQNVIVYVINRDGENIGSCGLTSGDLPIAFNLIDGYTVTYTLTDKPVRKYMSNLRRRIKLTKSEEERKELEEQLKGLESADKIVAKRRAWTTLSHYT